VTDLKREYQRRYGINARHFNALYAVLKGKIKSLIECRKRHIKHLQSSISGLEKLIRRWRKQVPHIPLACPLQQGDKTPRQLLRWRLHQKQRRLPTLKCLGDRSDGQPSSTWRQISIPTMQHGGKTGKTQGTPSSISLALKTKRQAVRFASLRQRET